MFWPRPSSQAVADVIPGRHLLHALQGVDAQHAQAQLEHLGGGGAQQQTALAGRFVHAVLVDRAGFVEGHEVAGQLVQIGTEQVRHPLSATPLTASENWISFWARVSSASSFRTTLPLRVSASTPALRKMDWIRVRRRIAGRGGVAFKRQHQIPVEDVVGGAVLGEIRILTAPMAMACTTWAFFGRGRCCGSPAGRWRALPASFQQVNQLDGAAGAGLVGTAVLAQHHAEGVVLEGHGPGT